VKKVLQYVLSIYTTVLDIQLIRFLVALI